MRYIKNNTYLCISSSKQYPINQQSVRRVPLIIQTQVMNAIPIYLLLCNNFISTHFVHIFARVNLISKPMTSILEQGMNEIEAHST